MGKGRVKTLRYIQVEESRNLRGSIQVPGSKNSSQALLAAACMADEPVRLAGVPDLDDFRVIRGIASDVGVRMEREASGDVLVDSRGIHGGEIEPGKAAAFRSSYYYVGALLAKVGKVRIGYPGGDDFVSRPIDQHFKLFAAMGAAVERRNDHYEVRVGQAGRLIGADVYFDMVTCGATINGMMLASRANGVTRLMNAACDPEVVDTANLLNRMGAKISGAGTEQLRIEGVSELGGAEHRVIPDRLIAGSLLMTAGLGGGNRGSGGSDGGGGVTVTDVIPEHMRSCFAKLREVGFEFDIGEDWVTAAVPGSLKAVRVRATMYPGFATDLQQPLSALLTLAPGRSIVRDMVFPHRTNHAIQLGRMGAAIELRNDSMYIQGGRRLHGGWVHANDIRAGTGLIMAGMAADGVTRITGVEHIERGYEDVVGLFRSLGANISLQQGESEKERSGVQLS
jgi:UDP-N-acetylglucosamine 1-carboxyvinyltransferase